MQGVSAGLGDDVDDCTARTAKLGIEVRGLDAGLLNTVRIGDLKCLTGDGNIVVLHAIDHEVVGAVPCPVYRERA